MKLIVGLGNPGEKYQKTRHNIGFLVVEKIAKEKGIVFRLENTFESRVAEIGELDNRIKLVEPQTYMNESGRAIGKIKNYWKVDTEDIWVIHDEVDLEFGKVKIQLEGSSAGHKGVQSAIDNIGSKFWRIRVGVGKSDQIPTDQWVLQNFTEKEKLDQVIEKVSKYLLDHLSDNLKEESFLV